VTFVLSFTQELIPPDYLPPKKVASTYQPTGEFGRLAKDLNCQTCHGAEGKGNGPTASTFPPDHQPRDYHHKDQFKFGWEAKAVAETISEGRPPYMPSHPQLNAEQLAALAEFVRSLGQGP